MTATLTRGMLGLNLRRVKTEQIIINSASTMNPTEIFCIALFMLKLLVTSLVVVVVSSVLLWEISGLQVVKYYIWF